jgi:hypothetical protein
VKETSELADLKKLPDDLKLLLREHHVSNDDPLVVVLAWHWQRMNKSRDLLEEATTALTVALDERQKAIQDKAFEIGALLDERLKQLDKWTTTLQQAFGHLETLNNVLSQKPLVISEQITQELAHPIGQSVTLVKQLATDTTGLVGDVGKERQRLYRTHVITAFLSGYATAALILSWTLFHFFLH